MSDSNPATAVSKGARRFVARTIDGVNGPVEVWGRLGMTSEALSALKSLDPLASDRSGAPNPHSPTPDPFAGLTGPHTPEGTP